MMSETELPTEIDDESAAALRLRAEGLEQRVAELQKYAESRVILAELKVEAVRAGMIDLDGLRLIDLTPFQLNENGEVDGATQLMAQLKRSKPWLFRGTSTSSAARAPSAQPARQKHATEMTDEEYREARASILRRHP